MKKDQYEYPKSSFLGMSKDTALIMRYILSNNNLLKLLFYNTKDWQKKPILNADQIKTLINNKQISNVPRVLIDKEMLSYIRVSFDNFTPNATNPFYRDHIVEIKIIVHFDLWDLGDYELRPYRIAGELDSMLNNKHLSGIGVLNFLGATADIYDEEFGGLTLRYLAIRGNEDKVGEIY